MLETLIRFSRHRWTVLKLPPRRMERRLVAAAHWFGEQLSLHWVGRVDLLFASDALNLADLYRFVPALSGKPSVAYFHLNHLPPDGEIAQETDDLPSATAAVIANISTAAAANELWFNSAFHQKCFLERATTFLEKHSQTFARSPLSDLPRKTRVMVPPTDMHLPDRSETPQRDQRTLFVDTRDADVQLLNDGLEELLRRNEEFKLYVSGPDIGLSKNLGHASVSDKDPGAMMEAMRSSAIAVSGRIEANWDQPMMLALAAGCWPVVPASGVYLEIIPKPLSERCLYESTPQGIAATIQDYWELLLPDNHAQMIATMLKRYNPIAAAKAMDDRFSELAALGPVQTPPPRSTMETH